jgi:ubiquinone/menaquinone biosynthesis C-methylase UbiE
VEHGLTNNGRRDMDAAQIYRHHPERYHELVSAEDVQGNLAAALERHLPLRGREVLEVGAGTGRVTEILLERGAARVIATDREPAMLRVAADRLGRYGDRLELRVADATTGLPLADRSVDLALAGWVFGHLRHWLPERWRESIRGALSEMTRTLRAGGPTIVIETLGTGATEPSPPNDALGEFYRWLEREEGFQRESIRTDYRFESVEEAARITGFFFGAAFGEIVRERGSTIVPECTGIWSRRKP